MQKSAIFPVGDARGIDQLVGEMGCSVGTLPTTYLVLPQGAKFKSSAIWEGVKENFRRKQAAWKS